MKKVKRYLKRNMFNIPFVVLVTVLLCFASRVEYNTEVQEAGQGQLHNDMTALAMELEENT